MPPELLFFLRLASQSTDMNFGLEQYKGAYDVLLR